MKVQLKYLMVCFCLLIFNCKTEDKTETIK